MAMRVPEPQDILKDLGMQVGGAKQELVDRILAGVPAWEEPEDLCFEYDVANPRVKVCMQGRALSGKSTCVRCIRPIAQGSFRIGFHDRDHSIGFSGIDITRWSHAECFARFPPLGIKDMKDINWGERGPCSGGKRIQS